MLHEIPYDSLENHWAVMGVVYQFENFRLDPENRVLIHENKDVTLQARSFDCLTLLVKRAGHLVTKNEMMDLVWTGSYVEEANIVVAVSNIRRALKEDVQTRKFIQTVSGRGYRFISPVQELHEAEAGLQAKVQPLSHLQSPPLPVETPAGISPTLALTSVATDNNLEPNGSSGHTATQRLATPELSKPRSKSWNWIAAAAVLLLLFLAAGASLRRNANPEIASLAILPFQTDRADDPDIQMLLGLEDTLVEDLNKSLPVRPLSSVLRFSPQAKDVVSVGRELNVDAILTGHYQHGPTVSTMALKIVRSSDGRVLWNTTLSSRAGNMIELQANLEQALRPELARLARAPLANPAPKSSRPINTQAYQRYLLGRYYWNRRTADALRHGIVNFKESVTFEPEYAPAYAGMADSYAILASFSVEPGASSAPDARAAALSAIHLDPSLAEPYASLGMVSFFSDWNGLEAEKEFEKAITLDPNYATAHQWYSLDLAAMGRMPQALYEARKARELEPLSLMILTNVGWIQYLSRNYPEAIKEYKNVIELDPTFARARTRLGIVEMNTGDYRSAIENLQAAESFSNHDPYVTALLAEAEALNGQPLLAQSALDHLRQRSKSEYVPPICFALIYIGMGNKAEALSALQEAFRDRSTALSYAKVDPSLDSLRDDPRFKQMLADTSF